MLLLQTTKPYVFAGVGRPGQLRQADGPGADASMIKPSIIELLLQTTKP
jgi:hypothetical protein